MTSPEPFDLDRELREMFLWPHTLEIYQAAESRIRTHVTRLEAENAALRAYLPDLRHAGGMLANICYNLAQRDVLEADVRDTMRLCQKRWDTLSTLAPVSPHAGATELVVSRDAPCPQPPSSTPEAPPCP